MANYDFQNVSITMQGVSQTYVLTVGKSAAMVKVKVNGQYIQKLFGQRSNKNFSVQNTLQSLKLTMKHNTF